MSKFEGPHEKPGGNGISRPGINQFSQGQNTHYSQDGQVHSDDTQEQFRETMSAANMQYPTTGFIPDDQPHDFDGEGTGENNCRYWFNGLSGGFECPDGRRWQWQACWDKARLVSEGQTVGKPDMSILADRQDFSPVFDISPFPRKIQSWLKAHAILANAPIDYVVSSYLASIAALIGVTRQVRAWGEWREYLIFWVLVVGGPSSGKTPGLRGPKAVLNLVEKPKRKKWRRELTAWKKAKEDGKQVSPAIPPGDKPKLERSTIADCTPEKKAELLEENPKGLLETVDEMASLVGQNDRYKSGAVDRSFQLSCYSGETFTKDRVKDDGEPTILERPGLSRLGGIQPDKLHLIYGGDDDGYGARHLVFAPAPVAPMRPSDELLADDAAMLEAFERLDNLDFLDGEPVCLALTTDAANVFEAWWIRHTMEARKTGGRLGAILGKMQGQALRLALALTYSHWSVSGSDESKPKKVGTLEVEAAIAWIDGYFKPTVKNVLGAIGKPEQAARLLAKEIARRRPDKITATEVRTKWKVPELKEAKLVMEAVGLLIDLGWLEWTDPNNKKGATRKREWTVNPKVFENLPTPNASNATNDENTQVNEKPNGAQMASNASEPALEKPNKEAIESVCKASESGENPMNTSLEAFDTFEQAEQKSDEWEVNI